MFIGVKLIDATPMNRQQYNDYRGWVLPSDENGTDEGYLVEYMDGGERNHPNHQGYISWSPKEVFERAYRETRGMSFGLAIEAMKLGKKVCREGWNGKGMWVAMSPGSQFAPEHAKPGHAAYHLAHGRSEPITLCPHIDMKAADGTLVIGWLASQTDMLADDWMTLD
ncbi:MAG: DUF2829 domain-containing protein [Pseudomonadota bacterium]|nr:DUF2829 domain-containing protein [Pseudomonadota bacterium]